MARRRRGEGGDSLELLLDTVCNVFGGIIFIAILVALLTNSRAQVMREDLKGATATWAEHRRQAALAARVVELEGALAELGQLGQSLDSQQAQNAAALGSAIGEQQAKADQRRERAERWLKDYADMRGQDAASVAQRRTEANAALAAAEREAAEVKRTKTIQGRLPFQRQTTKRQILLLVVRNRAYAVPLGDARAELIAQNLDQEVSVQEQGDGCIVRPRFDRGLAVDGDVAQSADFAELMKGLAPKRHFLDMYVFEDSAEGFRRLRDAALARGFSYNVHPQQGTSGEVGFVSTDRLDVQ